jgi:hypothetical protein
VGAHVATADRSAVPQVVFTSPQVASVGPTLAPREDAGLRVRALDVDLAQIAGAATHAQGYAGTARALVDVDRGVIIGGTLVGPDVAEMLQALTIAVVGEVPLERLWHAVPAYPTVSELWLRWLEAFGRPGVRARSRARVHGELTVSSSAQRYIVEYRSLEEVRHEQRIRRVRVSAAWASAAAPTARACSAAGNE